jgi:hypothetical protein
MTAGACPYLRYAEMARAAACLPLVATLAMRLLAACLASLLGTADPVLAVWAEVPTCRALPDPAQHVAAQARAG